MGVSGLVRGSWTVRARMSAAFAGVTSNFEPQDHACVWSASWHQRLPRAGCRLLICSTIQHYQGASVHNFYPPGQRGLFQVRVFCAGVEDDPLWSGG